MKANANDFGHSSENRSLNNNLFICPSVGFNESGKGVFYCGFPASTADLRMYKLPRNILTHLFNLL